MKTYFPFLILLSSIFLITIFGLPMPTAMVVLDAGSEVIRISGLRPDSSSIWLDSAYDSKSQRCFEDVVLRPGIGAEVKYSTPADGSTRVRTYGNWTVQSEKTGSSSYSTSREFVVASNSKCKHSRAIRLPLNGYLELGSEQVSSADNSTLLLNYAELTLYGRAIDHVLGFIPLKRGPFDAHSLYLADYIAVPAGSRVSGAVASHDAPARWWGFIDIELTNDGHRAQMRAQATTNAVSVNIFAPSPSVGRIGEPDRLQLTSGVRFTKDPNLLWIISILGLVALLVGFIQK